jgi:hypothetical protein
MMANFTPQGSNNPGLKLANAFGVKFKLHQYLLARLVVGSAPFVIHRATPFTLVQLFA